MENFIFCAVWLAKNITTFQYQQFEKQFVIY